ncbi:T9SS type A sorting domain-containing protein [Xanthomarina spongicola]|uniref:Putative secreted protein (Por secretion system target) n=1 Tax=Xanthomarina spongicola TaxID=570520 RepID=A0A316DP76_9FLAO|nr:T9SS type A sorting domain-containing protein [Xanthomarina spongicola]PWK18563.1 putative secreted protein (Por secretion system target) [Xanthomarina spongicola]
MKNYYLISAIFLTTLFCSAQNYELGIVHISNYDFKVVAIPDFDSVGNTDISDIGFTIVLPSGSVDVVNPVGLLTARTWTVQQFDATFLTGQGLGDGSKDVFQFNLPPGQSILAHASGQQIDLVNFQVTNDPVSGQMNFLLNSDPITMGAGGVLDSFYNSNIDATTTQDYFSMPNAILDNFMFSTLSVDSLQDSSYELQVFPNPVSKNLNIISKLSGTFMLIDANGKEIFNGSIKNGRNTIDLSRLNSGIYFIRFNNDSNITIRKIMRL